MTNYCCDLMLEKWIKPFVDTEEWEFFDLSCKHRDATNDQVLHDAVEAGARLGAIFKEPTVTPSAVQIEEMGLSQALCSPNGAMRKGWNGITISRDTIMIPGIKLGFDRPVFFERHAVGGEYGAGWMGIGSGRLETKFYPDSENVPAAPGKIEKTVHYKVDSRTLDDAENVAVVYHNPLDNVADLAHHFFKRCLDNSIVPYVVTKKTVFKWQETFWEIMKKVFDDHYREDFRNSGLMDDLPDRDLQHLISDAATMQIIRWEAGGFGMAAHNYDGDMLTDEIAQVHRSPGFITSNLIGKNMETGELIKEFEASHGTVADLWHQHLAGEETSLNPMGLVEALIGAMQHSASLTKNDEQINAITNFTEGIRSAIHANFVAGYGTRDLCGPEGLTTEEFIDAVAKHLTVEGAVDLDAIEPRVPEGSLPDTRTVSAEVRAKFEKVDIEKVQQMFETFDVDGTGVINCDEFAAMLVKLGVAPQKKKANKE